MKVLYRYITDSLNPIIDFGDSWGRIDENGEPLFQISKEEEPNWLVAFVAKWMQEDENLTEFGEHYCNAFYGEQNEKRDEQLEKGGKAATLGEIRIFGGKKYEKTSRGWRLLRKDGKAAGSEKREAEEEGGSKTVSGLVDKDKDTISAKLSDILDGKDVKLTKEENTAVLKRVFSGYTHMSGETIEKIAEAVKKKIIFPPFEFKEDISKFEDFLQWIEVVDDRDGDTLVDNRLTKEFYSILRDKADKYKAYGIKDVDSKLRYLDVLLNGDKFDKESVRLGKEIREKVVRANAIYDDITSDFGGSGTEVFHSKTVMDFFEGEEPRGGSSGDDEFEPKYFTKQIWNDFITAQQNVLEKDTSTFENLDFFEASAINYYTFHFSALNKVLNDSNLFEKSAKLMTPVMKAYFSVLKTALNKIPATPKGYQKNMYRFVNFDSSLLDKYEEGSTHVWPAFSSFTTNDELKDIKHNTKLVVENDGESFKPIHNLSEYRHQWENLVGPPMAVQVTKKEKKGSTNIIYLKIIK